MKKSFAFTLAEVLIAMAIIGIVSALALPTLMVNLKAREYRVALSKGINSLARAATANYGTYDYDFSGANGYHGEADNPVALYSTAAGPADGYAIIGFDTPTVINIGSHSDLYPYTTSLFHIWTSNLSLRSSKSFTNYAVMPADITLNCAGNPEGTTVKLSIPGEPNVTSATLKRDFQSREYWTASIVQGSGGIFPLCHGRSLEDGGINQGRMFMMDDGMVFTYDPAQAYCLDSNPCYGYLDVNGPAGPNRIIACTEGEDSFITTYSKNALPGMIKGTCTVKSKDVTDIYPILFYGNSVKPASWAAKSVLYSLKSNQVGIIEEANEASE